MFKKTSCLLLVLIANVLLVAHGILPHEHDGGFACLSVDKCENHHHPAGIHTEDSDHKHHNHDHDQPCLLTQAYLIPEDSSRLDCPVSDHNKLSLDFQLLFTHPDTSGFLPSFFKVPVPPLIFADPYPVTVTCSSGLRAPPAL